MAEQTEMEIAGVKFKGGKIFLVLTALSTLGGGAYAAFEFWKDYQDLKEQIQNYVAPDLSGLDTQLKVLLEHQNTVEEHMSFVSKEIALFKEEIQYIKESADEQIEYVKDMKNGIRDDIKRVEAVMDQVEDDIKEVEADVRQMIQNAEERFENKRDALQNDYDQAKDRIAQQNKTDSDDLRNKVERDIEDLEKRLGNKLQRALDNPLAN